METSDDQKSTKKVRIKAGKRLSLSNNYTLLY